LTLLALNSLNCKYAAWRRGGSGGQDLPGVLWTTAWSWDEPDSGATSWKVICLHGESEQQLDGPTSALSFHTHPSCRLGLSPPCQWQGRCCVLYPALPQGNQEGESVGKR